MSKQIPVTRILFPNKVSLLQQYPCSKDTVFKSQYPCCSSILAARTVYLNTASMLQQYPCSKDTVFVDMPGGCLLKKHLLVAAAHACAVIHQQAAC
jgi:hypothetical protein